MLRSVGVHLLRDPRRRLQVGRPLACPPAPWLSGTPDGQRSRARRRRGSEDRRSPAVGGHRDGYPGRWPFLDRSDDPRRAELRLQGLQSKGSDPRAITADRGATETAGHNGPLDDGTHTSHRRQRSLPARGDLCLPTEWMSLWTLTNPTELRTTHSTCTSATWTPMQRGGNDVRRATRWLEGGLV